MADAVKSVRQGMQQEAADEFVGRQRHDLVLVVMAIVAPAEADLAAGERDQPAVGDGDAVRVAAEIGQYRLGAGERALGIDDPLAPPQLGEAPGEDSGSASAASAPKKPSLPASNAAPSFSRNSRRNSRESTRTGRKKPGRQETQRVPSRDKPPPGTRQ